ncbi:MAG TPA: THUMP domain-containing protein [Thiobacillaceae bacterium]|nr:THUMP domain-containing protein [Thiobacillaceae bacterium]
MANKPKTGTLGLGKRPAAKTSRDKSHPTLSALRRGKPGLHRGKKEQPGKPIAEEPGAGAAKPARPWAKRGAAVAERREAEAPRKPAQRRRTPGADGPHEGDRSWQPKSVPAKTAESPRQPREETRPDRTEGRPQRRAGSESGESRYARTRTDKVPRVSAGAGPQRGDRERLQKPAAPQIQTCFATCPRGLEALLAQELAELGAEEAETAAGGVAFKGDWTFVYRANLHSRLATRILLRVSAGKYANEDDVYQGALNVYWERWFDPSRTIAVKVVAINSPLKSLNFITLKIKDAVCDRFHAETGERPSVQTVEPDIRIRAFLTRDRYTLYFDTSGEALYKRGLRKQAGLAPINENLAAGILKLSGWQPGEALFDPMCGSGTFLMEAALMSLNRAPGLGRSFAFEKFSRFDAKAWQHVREQAQKLCKPVTELPIYGSDVLGHSLKDADANLKAAGLREAVTLSKADILDIEAPAETGVMVMNPPYGVRLGDEAELAELYPKLGDVLKQKFAGWRAYIISADENLPKLIRLTASRKTPLYNGALECRLYEYKVVEGSNR